MHFAAGGQGETCIALTCNREMWSESSEDMNKEAGEMDEGSGQQKKRDKDGWSEVLAERHRKTEREGGREKGREMHGGDL